MNPTARERLLDGLAAIKCRWPGLTSPNCERPVFLLAAGWRSGSTFLQRTIMPECFLWGEPYERTWVIDSLARSLEAFSDHWPDPDFFYRGQEPHDLASQFIANLYPPVERFLDAHLAFFDSLFASPARKAGSQRWGLKEVHLGVEHAAYLRWLYPQASILLLYRNPYDAWRSYAARRAIGWRWYYRWPDQPITPQLFGRHWRTLTSGFLEQHERCGALLVRYEELAQGNFAPIEEHVGFVLSRSAAEVHVKEGPPPLEKIAEADLQELAGEVEPLASELGYSPPGVQGDVSGKPTSTVTGRSLCALLVPVIGRDAPVCDAALRELERRGYAVRMERASEGIDELSSQMAADALRDGFAETLSIASDIRFHPDAVDQLRLHPQPIVCGIYPGPEPGRLSCDLPPGIETLTLGQEGTLLKVPRSAAGFLLVRRQVYVTMQQQLQLPLCQSQLSGRALIPFFQPMVVSERGRDRYLTGGRAFTERARQCGYHLLADTSVRLERIGDYAYGWEDVGGTLPRHSTVRLRFGGRNP